MWQSAGILVTLKQNLNCAGIDDLAGGKDGKAQGFIR